jgi:hypothetical protein
MSWIQTHSGNAFDLADPAPDSICIEDIAHALSHLCRFAGHARVFYSVAQHSVLVAQKCAPRDARWGLLHDATEAYIADLPRPVKRLPGMEGYRLLEARIARAVARAFDLPGEDVPLAVKEVDARMLATEAAQLMGEPPRPWSDSLPPYARLRIDPQPPQRAKELFLSAFREFWP